ncbi:MAG TPA: nuclear transport factor 2 family protein [Reyranella sp.]|jgi:ketosteroid isomerase-like protein|nr:nuclear transport factor 2 family protein [Reyranella sp.]
MQTAAPRPAHDDLVAELRALNARFIHNYVTNDVESHDAMMHPDFICIGPKGTRQNRADYLKQWATQFDPEVVVYWDVRDEVITIIDNVALVRSTNKRTIRQDGKDTTSMSTYTDTYLFQERQWKCIQAQIQALPPESYPEDDTIVSVYIKGKRQ